jgi:hypothetical protein
MNNARLLLDILLAISALTTSFFRFSPATKAVGMVGFISPTATVRAKMPRLKKAKLHVLRNRTYTVTATVYQAVAGQTDNEPFVTADNSRIKPHYGSKKHWMALSQDLLKPWGGKFKYGDKVRVRGISAKLDGVYTIHDTMNRRHRHCMDILTHPSEKYDILCKDVKIQLVASN